MAAPFVQFFNEVSFIRVLNTRTGVTSFFQKKGLVFQSMDDANTANDSFFVKSGDYQVYARFTEVEIPVRANLAALLRQLATWAASDNAYAEIYRDHPHAVVQVTASYDRSPLGVDEALNTATPFPAVGGSTVGASNFAGGASLGSRFDASARDVVMAAPADATASGLGGRIVRQTKTYAACPADKHMVSLVTGTLLDGSGLGGVPYTATLSNLSALDYSRGTAYRMGVFDDRRDVLFGASNSGNGLFLEYSYDPARTDHLTDAGAVADMAALAPAAAAAYAADWQAARAWVVFRSSHGGAQVDRRTPQCLWNLDRLDVSGEGSLFDLDPTLPLTLVCKWGAVPGADCTLGVVNRSTVNWVHAYDTTDPAFRLGAASLPVRWELDNRSGASNAEMVQGRAITSCDGDSAVPGRPLSFDTHVTGTILNVPKQVPLLSFRMAADRNRGRVHPQRLNLLNTMGAGSCKYELRRNATLTGTTWTAGAAYSFDEAAAGTALDLAAQGSSVEVDTAATGVTGGHTVLSGYLFDTESRDVSLDFSETQLCSRIDGTSDTLTLVCFFIAGVCEVSASMTLVEYD